MAEEVVLMKGNEAIAQLSVAVPIITSVIQLLTIGSGETLAELKPWETMKR